MPRIISRNEPNPLASETPIPDIFIWKRIAAFIGYQIEEHTENILKAGYSLTRPRGLRDRSLHSGFFVQETVTADGDRAFELVLNTKEATTSTTDGADARSSLNLIKCQLSKTEAHALEHRSRQGAVLKQLAHLPLSLQWLICVCGLGAMIPTWDQAAFNSAQIYFQLAYGLDADDARLGYISAAPYVCCILSCWLSWPLNKSLGRRKTIFFSAFITMICAIVQIFAYRWEIMLACRSGLGLGIGPLSAVIPLYISEVAPARLRAPLVATWQLWTALGGVFGSGICICFANVRDSTALLEQKAPCSLEQGNDLLSWDCSLEWRLMLASPALAMLLILLCISWLPESPTWLIAKAHHVQKLLGSRKAHDAEQKHLDLRPAFASALRFNGGSEMEAARDLLVVDILLAADEEGVQKHSSDWQSENPRQKMYSKSPSQIRDFWEDTKSMFSDRRGRNAFLASSIAMTLQQYNGIIILVQYSTTLIYNIVDGNDNPITYMIITTALCGINILVGVPALSFIERFGRRRLLLWTIPPLGFCGILAGIGTLSSVNSFPLVLAAICFSQIFYGLGAGPVPLVLATESLPIQIRELGLGIITSLGWGFNVIVTMSYTPMLNGEFGTIGPFWYYAAWSFVGFGLTLLYVPETAGLELEQLDDIFDKSLKRLACENWMAACRFLQESKNIHLLRAMTCLSGRHPYSSESRASSSEFEDINSNEPGYGAGSRRASSSASGA